MNLRDAARAGAEDLMQRLDAAGRPWSQGASLWLDTLVTLSEATTSS